MLDLITCTNVILLIPIVLIVTAGIVATINTRFIQFRALRQMFTLLFKKTVEHDGNTISPRKALFTAMSTVIGTASIVSPIISMQLGGPGALVGFVFSSILGGALTFAEVTFAVHFRKKLKDGTIMGGPMQYLREVHPLFASWYAYAGLALLVVWSAAQANTIADLLRLYHVPPYFTGITLAITVVFVILGGIKRIGEVSSRIVPFMFFLYTSAALWILFKNYEQIPAALRLIFDNAWTPRAFTSGAVIGGLYHTLRWGLLRAIQGNEAGIGTSAIPHSMADTSSARLQGILAIISIYSHGFICVLSGLIVLVTGTWFSVQEVGIAAIAIPLTAYFSVGGPIILIVSTVLFAYGTILGNSYNGSQCFAYVTGNRYLRGYYYLTGLLIFLGSINPVDVVWRLGDFFLIPVAIPHIIGILILLFKQRHILNEKE